MNWYIRLCLLIPVIIPFIRDESDLPILASAITAGVDMIITGDKDFFCVDMSGKELPVIMSPSEFMENFS